MGSYEIKKLYGLLEEGMGIEEEFVFLEHFYTVYITTVIAL